MSALQNTEITFKITDKDILITNSYLVTDSTAMYKFLQRIMTEPEYSLYGYNRKMSSYIAEWKVHNWCYYLGIARSRTKDVNLDKDFNSISFLQRMVYKLISLFYTFYD